MSPREKPARARTRLEIRPSDLRDHADEARVARVWSRIEENLPHVAPASPRRASTAVLLAAAAIGLFGGGLFVGKAMSSRAPALATATPSHDTIDRDVLAAGSNERTFPLPSGGELTLEPGSTVEIEHDGSRVTLRLVQGEAKVDAADAQKEARLAIVAGDATLSAQAGSALRVKRNPEDLEVSVSSGLVSVDSPAGSQRLERGQRLDKVPIHSSAVAIAQPNAPRARSSQGQRRPNDPGAKGNEVAVAIPDWRAAEESGEHDRAYELLKQAPGGVEGAIASSASAEEILRMADVARPHDQAAAIKAYERILSSFKGSDQAVAAQISLDSIDEKTVCKQMRAEDAAGNKDKAARLASDYASRHPDGPCKDDAERLKLEGDVADASAPAPSAQPSTQPSAPKVEKANP